MTTTSTTESYNKLFKILSNNEITSNDIRFSIQNVLEIYLVLHGVRPATLLSKIKKENVQQLGMYLESINIRLFPYAGNNYFVFPSSNYEVRANARHIKENPKDHEAIGKILGYMTPVDIVSTNTSSSTDAQIRLSADLVKDGLFFKDIQLIPQKVVGDINDETIHAYYAPVLSILESFNKFQDIIKISDIHLVIKRYPKHGGTRHKTRKTRKLIHKYHIG